METAGNKTQLLVFVDISVKKSWSSTNRFGKEDPRRVVISYNVWFLSQPPQMRKISFTIFHSLFPLEFTYYPKWQISHFLFRSFHELFIRLFIYLFIYFLEVFDISSYNMLNIIE